MVVHYYDSKQYAYSQEIQKYLVREWHKQHGLPFPPAGDTHYDDVTRIITQGSYQVVVKTPPPWTGKIRKEQENG